MTRGQGNIKRNKRKRKQRSETLLRVNCKIKARGDNVTAGNFDNA